MMTELTQDNFEKEILKSNKPVLVDFWAPWCMPCKLIASTVEKLAVEMKDRVSVLKSNVDENPDIATELSIMNIPTLVLFKDGKEVSRIIGVNSKEAIEAKINSVL
ncbi:MAG: thioredoxin [Candidatus Omnitrophica bacterium]|nr:thioredoxin [Candidatus Omnitrophota bacterium]